MCCGVKDMTNMLWCDSHVTDVLWCDSHVTDVLWCDRYDRCLVVSVCPEVYDATVHVFSPPVSTVMTLERSSGPPQLVKVAHRVFVDWFMIYAVIVR